MNKIDFIGFIEVKNANPNGDIDMDNQPRQNSEGFGYMTDVCIKRRIKDCVALLKQNDEKYNNYIADDWIALESKSTAFVEECGGYDKIKDLSAEERTQLVKNGFKAKYFDARAFGSVVTSFAKDKYLDGKIQGAVQIGFAESLEEIFPQKITISRVSVQTEKDLEQKKNELGNKWIVPYAVYKFEGHINPFVAEKNGFSEEDKNVLIDAILKMYELNQSSASTGICMQKLFVFEHSSKYGDCNFKKLKNAIQIDKIQPEFGSYYYDIDVDKEKMPSTVKVSCFE